MIFLLVSSIPLRNIHAELSLYSLQLHDMQPTRHKYNGCTGKQQVSTFIGYNTTGTFPKVTVGLYYACSKLVFHMPVLVCRLENET